MATRLAALVTLALAAIASFAAQQTFPTPAAPGDPGFVSIFDGKTLAGWEGDAKYWRVEAGAIVGEVSGASTLKQNIFLVWRGGTTRDFELKIEFRVSPQGNSGVYYRSALGGGELRGYQADLDGPNSYTGNLYEDARTFVATRGQIVHATDGGVRTVIGALGDPKELAGTIGKDWNAFHLVVRGNVLIHILNGRVVCETIDDDMKARRMEGLLGVQLHVGPPMKVEYRNIRFKPL